MRACPSSLEIMLLVTFAHLSSGVPLIIAVFRMLAWIVIIWSEIGLVLLSGLGFVPSGASSACQCPRWHPDGDVLVDSFQFLNRPFKSLLDIDESMVGCGFLLSFFSIIWTLVGNALMLGRVPWSRFSVTSESPSTPNRSVNCVELNGVSVA